MAIQKVLEAGDLPVEQNKETKGIVFDISRFSVHDGHGIRTLVFLKGCPLSCQWCANPESIDKDPQLGFFKEKCSSCQSCVSVCPNGEYFKETGRIDWDKCISCFKCVDACLYDARVIYGKEMTVEEVMNVVRRDIPFYRKSGGGVTLGGGEATYQAKFAEEILKNCQEEGIHTAMETCGYTAEKVFLDVIRYVDLLLFDIKHMDTVKHKEYTGGGNEIILRNAVNAAATVKEMIVRFPLIPDFNDDSENVERMGHFIKENMPRVKRIDVLPYHSTGESKCERTGREFIFKHQSEIDDAKIEEVRAILKKAGLEVNIGG